MIPQVANLPAFEQVSLPVLDNYSDGELTNINFVSPSFGAKHNQNHYEHKNGKYSFMSSVSGIKELRNLQQHSSANDLMMSRKMSSQSVLDQD